VVDAESRVVEVTVTTEVVDRARAVLGTVGTSAFGDPPPHPQRTAATTRTAAGIRVLTTDSLADPTARGTAVEAPTLER
jgi:hypothetical protein